MNLSREDRKRFLNKINVKDSNGCRNWTAAVNNKGYGRFKLDGRFPLAHRIAWELVNGPIPYGKLVLHKCDNPRCCNTDHLYIGTYSDNNSDRAKRNNCSQGGGRSDIPASSILKIRNLHKDKFPNRDRHEISAKEVGRRFNISTSTVLRIWHEDSHLCKEGYYI